MRPSVVATFLVLLPNDHLTVEKLLLVGVPVVAAPLVTHDPGLVLLALFPVPLLLVPLRPLATCHPRRCRRLLGAEIASGCRRSDAGDGGERTDVALSRRELIVAFGGGVVREDGREGRLAATS